MDKNDITNLINLYNSLEIKKNAAHCIFGEDSKFTAHCVAQFLKVSHEIIENDLETVLLDKIYESETDESDAVQIDFSEFGLYIERILLEDVFAISHIEFALVVYYAINQICDLGKNREYWTKINRSTFLAIYENEYLRLKRCPVIDDILS